MYEAQICPIFDIKKDSSCNRACNLSLARSAHHRPYPLSVQWIHVWLPHSVHCARARGFFSTKRSPFRCSPMHEAHLSLLGSSLFCLFTTSILPRPAIYLPYPAYQLHKTRPGYHRDIWYCVWSIRVLGPNTAAPKQTVPFLERLMSRVLGPKYLGHVLILRSGLDIP